MQIYKLNYTDKEAAIADLLAKGVYVETTFEDITSFSYGEGIHAVVEIGKIVLTNGTYDANFKELTAPIFADGYAYDIMCEQKIDFGENEIFPKNSRHEFAGCEPIKEIDFEQRAI
jgi:hypothetical protein